MKMLMNVKFPHAKFNAAVRDGSASAKINRILDELKPEAVYFTEQDGGRGAVLVVDLPNPSAVPMIAEPWFLMFDATVELRVMMMPEDLKKAGLETIAKKWG